MPDLRIEDIGPIVEFEGQMDAPGLHVIRGGHGTGKTTILRTVTQVGGGKPDVKPTKRDGAKVGTASVGGKTLRVNKTKTTDKGELEFEGMETFDLPTIHWPNIQDPAKRDARRIAALVRLAGGTATIEDFRTLLPPGLWAEAVDESLIGDDLDPVEMAAKVKRFLDKAAKAAEDAATRAEASRDNNRDRIKDVDFDASTDRAELVSKYEAAIELRATLEQQQKDHDRSATEVALAKDRIREAEATYDGPSSVEAEKAAAEAHKAYVAAGDTVTSLEAKLAAARAELQTKGADLDAARAAFKTATDHEELMEQWKETVEKTAVAAPKAEAVVQCAETISELSRQIEACDKALEGIKVKEAIAESESIASENRSRAKLLRDAAAETQRILSDAIGTIEGCPLRVAISEDGEPRLVLDTDRSEDKPENFDELSDGERWDVIVDIVCKPGRVVVLSQAAFGELAPHTRAAIHRKCVERGAYLLTAQADDGELRLERYDD